MTDCKVYFLRYLPPKTTGNGEIVAAISTNITDFDAEAWKALFPGEFKRPGFYSVLLSVGDNLTMENK